MREIKEVWKDINEYEGIYQISNLGRVKSLPRQFISGNGRVHNSDEIIMSYILRNGYPMVLLSKNGVKKSKSIHRLVAKMFVPNPNNYPIVNHKDQSRDNNVVDNLEWCTYKYNVNYGNAIDRRSESRCKPVEQLTLNGDVVREYPSLISTKEFGFCPKGVSKCCREILKTHSKYKWRFI